VKQLILTADDFGLDPAVNQAVETAHKSGVLSSASLMVAAPAAADAIDRARRLPDLRVGLHLVLVDGRPLSPPAAVPALIGQDGHFVRNLVRAGFRFGFRPEMRRQLATEIRAQFEAFRATGLALDHVDTHKHMHLHPTIATMMLAIGRDYGMRAVRVPIEPKAALRRAYPEERVGTPFYRPWIELLRRRLVAAGMIVNDYLFGLAWSGRMVETRVLRLLPHLPEGVSELYFHPAISQNATLRAAMPGYRVAEEFSTLISEDVRARIAALGVVRTSYGALAARHQR
jgi:hopanoid biosynthesis associated protein HpnK